MRVNHPASTAGIAEQGVAPMKTLSLTILVMIAVALAGGQALATAGHANAPKTLTVVMHDPGCHWFAIGSKFKLSANVAGPVNLANDDEAALIVRGAGKVKQIPVGRKLLLTRGHYVITMVKQAPDDNHLKLTVR
jgi:hypothetical protein